MSARGLDEHVNNRRSDAWYEPERGTRLLTSAREEGDMESLEILNAEGKFL